MNPTTDPTQYTFNGIDGSTGGYVTPPLSEAEVSRLAQGVPLDESHEQDLRSRIDREQPTFAPIEDVDPMDLGQSGWGAIFPHDFDPSVRDALRELLDHRKAQASKVAARRYQEYVAADAVRRAADRPCAFLPGDTKSKWLARNGAKSGMAADPDKVPYYLLIVASPSAIPFEFQYQLDVEYAVGRVWFEGPDGKPDLDAFARYARSVVEAETTQPPLARRAHFFAARNEDDDATNQSAPELAVPLSTELLKTPSGRGWTVTADIGDGEIGKPAKKARLAEVLGGKETPALLFTASHGMGFPTGDAQQAAFQGALLCQDWGGPRSGGGRISRDTYFGAEDIGADARLGGLIAFHFACFGAGTPATDDFAHLPNKPPRSYATPRPVVARLPQRLLGHPKGGALAVIGHVERAWTCSFRSPDVAGRQLQTFQSTLSRLMKGMTVGFALEYFNQYHAALGTEFGEAIRSARDGFRPTDLDRTLSQLWTANNDARNFVVIGDPAVRLSVADAGGERTPIRPTAFARAAGPGTPLSPPPAPNAAVPPPPPPPTGGRGPGRPFAGAALPAAPSSAAERVARRQRLLSALQGRKLEEAYLRPEVRADLVAEAADPHPDQLLGPEELDAVRRAAAARAAEADEPAPFLFRSTDQVVLVPGFMASELSDVGATGFGLIWLSPVVAVRDRLSALRLGAYDGTEQDSTAGARVEATAALPLVYDLLRLDLEMRRYTFAVHAVDWRKDLELAADRLAARLQGLTAAGRPIHLIAHSQGALVARRALQRLRDAGQQSVLDGVKNLVLLGPANYGTFSAAFALGGSHSLLPTLRRFAVEPAAGFQSVLATMSGLYQLLPWDPARVPWLTANPIGDPAFWAGRVGIDETRLRKFFGWGSAVDSSFFAAKTTVILGDNSGVPTPGGAVFSGGALVPSADGLAGDGTVPHSCSVLPGARTLLAPGTEHAQLPLYRSVVAAVRDVLAGRTPALASVSDNPADHLQPRDFALVSFAPPPVESAPAAAEGGRAARGDDTGFGGLLHEAAAAVAATGVRVRIQIDITPQ